MKPKRLIRKLAAALNLDLFATHTTELPAPAVLNPPKATTTLPPLPVAVKPHPPKVVKAELPNEAELARRFDYYNQQYYDGKLNRPRIIYSTRMKAAGSYTPSEHLIRIGKAYHEIFPDDLNSTLKHEMIHLLYMKHDRKFKEEAKRLGTTLKARYHQALIRPPKFVYACPSCSKSYPRQKRLVMASCGSCSPKGRFDKRFKLKLISSAAKK